ncbi:MAG: PD40 domain-containing protein [Anaerolineales bacterium]|nr:PD40 domain-containing protein [Anaerolineales bacterium]
MDNSNRIYGRVYLHDLSEETFVQLEGHGSRVIGASASSDGSNFVTTSQDGKVKIWDSRDGTLLDVIDGFFAEIRDLEFTNDGAYLVVRYADQSLVLWDYVLGTKQKTITLDEIYDFVVFPNNDKVGTGSNLEFNIWDINTQEKLFSFEHQTNLIKEVAISPDGRYFVGSTAPPVSVLYIWDADTGALLDKLGQSFVSDIGFSPDSKIVGITTNTYISFTDISSKRVLRKVNYNSKIANGFAFSPDGKYAATYTDSLLSLWNYEDWSLASNYEFDHPIVRLTFSPDSSMIVYHDNEGRRMVFWDISSEKEVYEMPLTYTFPTFKFSPDGKFFALEEGNSSITLLGIPTSR